MPILLVEDQPDAARMIAKGSREESDAVDVAVDGENGWFKALTADYDVIVLDVMLPLRDGLSVCRQLRQDGSSVPILMLTARDGVEARVAGPELDTCAHRVRKKGRPVPLTAREHALLEYLARCAGEVVGRADIAEHVWDGSAAREAQQDLPVAGRVFDVAGAESLAAVDRERALLGRTITIPVALVLAGAGGGLIARRALRPVGLMAWPLAQMVDDMFTLARGDAGALTAERRRGPRAGQRPLDRRGTRRHAGAGGERLHGLPLPRAPSSIIFHSSGAR